MTQLSPFFRLDRLLTIHVLSPFLRRRVSRKPFLPILMYHSISNDPEYRRHPYHWLNTSPTVFREQMQFLAMNNFSVISLEEAIQIFKNRHSYNSKIIALTFDDGYQDFLTEAFPILNEFGFKATVFLPTSFIGKNRLFFNNKPCLTWSEVKQLYEHKIRFGSHTVNHPKLLKLNKTEILNEINLSKRSIENILSDEIQSFSYPYALSEASKDHLNYIKCCLIEFGYTMGVSTRIGCSPIDDDIFLMKRLPVNSGDDLSLLSAKILGYYNWLFGFQFIIKVIKQSPCAAYLANS